MCLYLNHHRMNIELFLEEFDPQIKSFHSAKSIVSICPDNNKNINLLYFIYEALNARRNNTLVPVVSKP